MYITFKNNSTSEKMIISAGNQKQAIKPEEETDMFFPNEKAEFTAQVAAFDELIDGINETDSDGQKESFKDRVLTKLTKKFIKKMSETVLVTSVKYEVTASNSQNVVVNLTEGAYSVCDGKICDFLDIMPVGMIFSRAETDDGQIKVVDVAATNRKKFLKLMRSVLLFSHWGFLFVELFLFTPEYLMIKFFSSHFYLKKLFAGLYKKSANERAVLLTKKEQLYEKEEKGGCLRSIIKGLVVLLILGGLCYWAMTSEPEVIISEDFQSVVCYDETFVKFDGELPEDAERVFLEDYTAYYPLTDGEYDMDNYYCYIYEDSAGTRYMWLKDDCTDAENEDKDYADYENPLVYKSIGETK